MISLFVGGKAPAAGHLFPSPWDKLAHLTVYGLLTLNAYIAFPKKGLAFCIILTLGIGALDEVHQVFLPFRHAGLDDWAADLCGALSMAALIHWGNFPKRQP